MAISNLTTNDLARIAAAGGGFRLSANGRTVNDLARIAAAAAEHRSRITICDAGMFTVNDLARIGAAGQGAVVFED